MTGTNTAHTGRCKHTHFGIGTLMAFSGIGLKLMSRFLSAFTVLFTACAQHEIRNILFKPTRYTGTHTYLITQLIIKFYCQTWKGENQSLKGTHILHSPVGRKRGWWPWGRGWACRSEPLASEDSSDPLSPHSLCPGQLPARNQLYTNSTYCVD